MSVATSFKRTFSSLRHRNFRLLWMGTVVSNSGDWMDQIAFNWLILELTNSPLSLGLVNLCRAIPVLIATPLSGVAADRFERRRILMVTQSTGMMLAFLLGALVTTHTVQLWHIYLIAAMRGTLLSFNTPARQSMIPNMVPRSDLTNAVALNTATIQLSRVLGPSLGGILIALLGIDWLFYLNGLSFLAILYTLTLLPDTGKATSGKAGPLRQMANGFRYVHSHPTLGFLVTLALAPLLFGQPYMTMLAVFAHSVLQIGPAGLGLLTSVAATGAVVGALTVAGRRAPPSTATMIGGMLVFGTSLVLFSFTTWLPGALVFLFIAGASNVYYSSTNQTMIQSIVSDNYRGRVMSMLQLNRGMVPMGTAMTGFFAEHIGAPLALAGSACMVIVLGVVGYVKRPSSFHVRQDEEVVAVNPPEKR